MYCKQKYLAPVYILTFRPRCQRMKFKTVQIPMFQTIFLYFTTLSRRIQDGTKQFASEKGRKKNTIQYQLLIKRLISLSKKTVYFLPQTCLIEMNIDIYAWYVIPILMILHHRNSIIQYHMIQYHMLLYDTVWFDAISHDMAWYCMIWYNIVS